jgi:hypothetical protein
LHNFASSEVNTSKVSLFKLEFSNRNNLLIYHRYVFIPIGKYLEISDKIPKPVKPNEDLERTYSKDKKLNKNKVLKKVTFNINDNKIYFQLLNLVKQLDLTERQIERWWRQRAAQDKPTELKKFCESFWKSLFYAYNLIFGFIALTNKPWFWVFHEKSEDFQRPLVSLLLNFLT